MGTIRKHVDLSKRHEELRKASAKALKKVSEKLIAETKKLDSYLVISDEAGNIKKIPAKDL